MAMTLTQTVLTFDEFLARYGDDEGFELIGVYRLEYAS